MHVPLWLALLAAPAAAEHDAPEFRVGKDATRVEVILRLEKADTAALAAGKLKARAGERRLQLALVDAETGRAGPPIFGTYRRQGNTLVFTPRYGLVRGQQYRATRLADGKAAAAATYRVPALPTGPPAVVEAIYPTVAELPANLLKFYIQFSGPMWESRQIFDQIHILDARGRPVHDPWRRVELWTADVRRLTLWIHPGRVKTGVNLREELGPVLEPNREYTLVIESSLRDAAGRPLGRKYTKKFRTTAAVRTRPDPRSWKLSPPPAGSKAPLAVTFPQPLDHSLVQRVLTVHDPAGARIAGRIETDRSQRRWSFYPREPWLAVEHVLRVDPLLEDLAGNTPERTFDLDLKAPPQEKLPLTVPFRPTAAAD